MRKLIFKHRCHGIFAGTFNAHRYLITPNEDGSVQLTLNKIDLGQFPKVEDAKAAAREHYAARLNDGKFHRVEQGAIENGAYRAVREDKSVTIYEGYTAIEKGLKTLREAKVRILELLGVEADFADEALAVADAHDPIQAE